MCQLLLNLSIVLRLNDHPQRTPRSKHGTNNEQEMQPNPRADTSNIQKSTYERIRPPKAQSSLESDGQEGYHYIHDYQNF